MSTIIPSANPKADRNKERGDAPIAFALRLTPKGAQSSDDISDSAKQSAQEATKSAQPASPGEKPEDSLRAVLADNRDPNDLKQRAIAVPAAPDSTDTKFLEVMPLSSGSAPITRSDQAEPQHSNVQSLTGALRTEAPAPNPPTSSPSPIQEISLRINRAEQAIDVHVAERGGQLHVAVRTPDSDLQTSLRQDLGTLVRSLDRAGFHADAIAPNSGFGTPPPSSVMNATASHEQNSNSNPDRHSGGQSGGQQQPQDQKQNRKEWIQALENAQ